MRLSIASGKGGTGKTTLAVSLAGAMAAMAALRPDGEPVRLLDCDVEQPNDHLFFKIAGTAHSLPVNVSVPLLDEDSCTGCGQCAQACRFGALAAVKGRLLSFPELCHGCGACWLTCETGGVRPGSRQIGSVFSADAQVSDNCEVSLVWGQLDPGQPLAPPVIGKVKELGLAVARDSDTRQVVIIDAPPGTSCPLVETVRDTDLCLLVTEPTPFGLHDLQLATEVLSILAVPTAVVINRDGIGDPSAIERFCAGSGLPVAFRIPFSRRIAEAVSRGGTLLDADPLWGTKLLSLWDQCREWAGLGRMGGLVQ